MELREIVTFKFGKWAKIMGFDPILKLTARGGGNLSNLSFLLTKIT